MNKKLDVNDSCWCGSGKIFKDCHYPDYGLAGISKEELEVFGSSGVSALLK